MPGILCETRLNRPGLDFHHADAERCQLHTQRVAQGMYGSFRGTVGAREWRDQNTGHTANIHDKPFAPAQHRKQCAGDPDNREHVGFELTLHGGHAAVEQRAHGAVTGVVDQHIEAAVLLIDSLAKLRQCRAVIDVELHRNKPG